MSQFEMFDQEALTPAAPAVSPPPPKPGPEAARKTSLRITSQLLGQLRDAQILPWDAGEVSMYLAMFRSAAGHLEVGEAQACLSEMDAQLDRLGALSRNAA